MALQPSSNRSEELMLVSLRHPEYYARKVSSMERETGLSPELMLRIAERHPLMNIFSFQGEAYIGLKDREQAYEQDAERGINPFEASFKGEEYRRAVLNGMPRFHD